MIHNINNSKKTSSPHSASIVLYFCRNNSHLWLIPTLLFPPIQIEPQSTSSTRRSKSSSSATASKKGPMAPSESYPSSYLLSSVFAITRAGLEIGIPTAAAVSYGSHGDKFLYGDSGGRDAPPDADAAAAVAPVLVRERVVGLCTRGGVRGAGALVADLTPIVLAGESALCAFCVTDATGGGVLARRARVDALRGTGTSSGGSWERLLARARDGMVMGANAWMVRARTQRGRCIFCVHVLHVGLMQTGQFLELGVPTDMVAH